MFKVYKCLGMKEAFVVRKLFRTNSSNIRNLYVIRLYFVMFNACVVCVVVGVLGSTEQLDN
jgi:hypothetical protein